MIKMRDKILAFVEINNILGFTPVFSFWLISFLCCVLQIIVCLFVIFILAIVLSICYFYFGHCIVYLSFLFWPLYCLFVIFILAIVLSICYFYFGHCIVYLFALFDLPLLITLLIISNFSFIFFILFSQTNLCIVSINVLYLFSKIISCEKVYKQLVVIR